MFSVLFACTRKGMLLTLLTPWSAFQMSRTMSAATPSCKEYLPVSSNRLSTKLKVLLDLLLILLILNGYVLKIMVNRFY